MERQTRNRQTVSGSEIGSNGCVSSVLLRSMHTRIKGQLLRIARSTTKQINDATSDRLCFGWFEDPEVVFRIRHDGSRGRCWDLPLELIGPTSFID